MTKTLNTATLALIASLEGMLKKIESVNILRASIPAKQRDEARAAIDAVLATLAENDYDECWTAENDPCGERQLELRNDAWASAQDAGFEAYEREWVVESEAEREWHAGG